MSLVGFPLSYFPDPTIGRPVYNGFIYIGQPDTDPEIVANRKTVRLRQENGVEVVAAQPIRTGAGGVPLYNGTPVQIIVDGNYSIKVLNDQGSQLYYIPSGANLTSLGSLVPQIDVQIATQGQTFFTLKTGMTYTVGGNDIAVYIDGRRQHPGAYTESSETSITFTEGLAAGQEVLLISNEIEASLSELQGSINPESGKAVLWDGFTVENIATLRTITGFPGASIQVRGYYAPGDGGGGPIRVWKFGAPPGTYVDNPGSVTVPTGGDGSAAWVWEWSGYINPKWFGAGLGQGNDGARVSAMLQAFPNGGAFNFSECEILVTDQRIDLNNFTNITIHGGGGKIISPNGAGHPRPFTLRNGTGLKVDGLEFICQELTNAPVNGLDLMNIDDHIVTGCRFKDQTFYGLGIYQDTFDLIDGTCNQSIIENNIFDGVRTIGLEPFPKVKSDYQIIRGNKFIDCGNSKISGNGAAMKPGQAYANSLVENNWIFNCGSGTESFAVGISNYDNLVLKGNTVLNPDRAGFAITLNDHGLYTDATYGYLTIKENSFIRVGKALSPNDGAITVTGASAKAATAILRVIDNDCLGFYNFYYSQITSNVGSLEIIGNTTIDTDTSPIFTSNSLGGFYTRLIMNENRFEKTKDFATIWGCYIRNATFVEASENIIVGAGEYSINFQNVTTAYVIKNDFVECNRTNIASRGAIGNSTTGAVTIYVDGNRILNGANGNVTALVLGVNADNNFVVGTNYMGGVTLLASNSTPTITPQRSLSLADTQIISGTGTPEGVVTARVGTVFLRRDGGAATTFYIKETGVGNTGWTSK